MPELSFQIAGAQAVRFAACPTIAFRLQVASEAPIHSVTLRCQILIEAMRRHYTARERASLCDLFGQPDRWSQTLRSLLWTHAAVTVPAFSGATEVSVPIPCAFDFNVSAAKYFYGIDDGDIPLCFQFSGTAFYAAPDGTLQIDQIGWDKEAKFRLPAKIWSEMMDHYYPNSAWLCLRREAFERLYEYKRDYGIATWEEAIESLLARKLTSELTPEKEAVS